MVTGKDILILIKNATREARMRVCAQMVIDGGRQSGTLVKLVGCHSIDILSTITGDAAQGESRSHHCLLMLSPQL